jgi:hypothetical protein
MISAGRGTAGRRSRALEQGRSSPSAFARSVRARFGETSPLRVA